MSSPTAPEEADVSGPDPSADLADASPAWAVVGGGTPDAAQLAAITVALTPVVLTAPAVEPAGPTMPNWRRAAIIEAIGGRPASSYGDLVQGRFGLGFVGDAGRRRALAGER